MVQGDYFFRKRGGIHNHKSYWKDPGAFIPDRFLEGLESKDLYMFGGCMRKRKQLLPLNRE